MEAQQVKELVLGGDRRAAARLMRDIDDGLPRAMAALKLLYPHCGRARVLGVTGSPGVGKSTLTDVLIRRYRQQGQTVGVVAVDPTSPFTGGAILGDRIRMQSHATDEGVFIRSLATRGAFGGLTVSTRGIVRVMDAMGLDLVLVETVGVGQDEVDIAAMADTTLIVLAPGLGDDIQAIKAGILEVGDIFVVNKADRPGAQRAVAEIEAMISLEQATGTRRDWRPPVIQTCAKDGQGIDELLEAVQRHHELLTADDGRILKRRRRARVRRELQDLLHERARRIIARRLEADQRLEELTDGVLAGNLDPYSASRELAPPEWSEQDAD